MSSIIYPPTSFNINTIHQSKGSPGRHPKRSPSLTGSTARVTVGRARISRAQGLTVPPNRPCWSPWGGSLGRVPTGGVPTGFPPTFRLPLLDLFCGQRADTDAPSSHTACFGDQTPEAAAKPPSRSSRGGGSGPRPWARRRLRGRRGRGGPAAPRRIHNSYSASSNEGEQGPGPGEQTRIKLFNGLFLLLSDGRPCFRRVEDFQGPHSSVTKAKRRHLPLLCQLCAKA